MSLVLSSPAALVMWTKTLLKLISLRCPQRLAAPSRQVWQVSQLLSFASSQSLSLQSCPQESQLSIAEECKLGIPCPVLRVTGAGSLTRHSRKWPLAPGMLGEEPVEGSLLLLSSSLGGTALTLCGFSTLHRNAAWGWVREKVAGARHVCNHGISSLACFA